MTAVCIDGHNLALATGSGIATYARTLLDGVRSVGFDRQILHAPPSPVPADALLREVMTGDARWRRLAAMATPKPNRRVQAALARFGRSAQFVAPSGQVLWPEHGDVPEAEAFWLSQDLYRIANRAFSNDRVVTPLRFAAGTGVPDVMHWTLPTPVSARAMPNIYTIHDLIPLKLPHTTLDDKRRFLDLCRRIVRDADHIVTVSDTTRRDVIEMLGADARRVTTTWQSADLPASVTDRSDVEVAREIESTFALPWKGYFVHFGAIEPKKNLGRLVEAYLRSGSETPLIVIGGKAWMDEQESGFLTELIAGGHGAGGRMRKYDYMPRAALLDLVRGARATLFPSLYEGFGLPVLESMMLGTPVMASDAGSLPEIAADAAVLVDPYDIDDMARGLRTLDADADLRAGLSIRGKARAAHFSPAAYTERLSSLYRSMGLNAAG
jgi:glycosyltransferase involved in cell wall biosynthesis